jgi:carbonic anhydrase
MGCQVTKTNELETTRIIKIDKTLVKKCRTQNKLTAHDARVFLITCMDFRLVDDDASLMNSLGYNTNYDLFVLAGASLGFVQKEYPHWSKSALDHMNIGLELDHFRKIIIIDHFDCGAFKKFMPYKDREEELKNHKHCIQETHNLLLSKYPNFGFKAFIMDLTGSATEISVEE